MDKRKGDMTKRLVLILGMAAAVIFLLIMNVQGIDKKGPGSAPAIETPSPQTSSSPVTTPSPKPTPVPLVGFCLRVPILMYHHIQPYDIAKKDKHTTLTVTPEYFEEHLKYLVSSGYTTVSVDQLAQALITHQRLPSKTVVITMDDGYQDIYTNAYPLIQKYRVTVNLMIPTGLIGNFGFLSWDNLREMVNSGLVNAYDHTWSHLSLGSAPREKIQYEVVTAKKQLEDNLGRKVDIFAYPYGSENQTVMDILRANGFVAAVSTIPGFYQCDSFLLSLHRSRVGNASLSSYGL